LDWKFLGSNDDNELSSLFPGVSSQPESIRTASPVEEGVENDDTSAAVPSSKYEAETDQQQPPLSIVHHARSHSDDSKARRGILVPDLHLYVQRGDLGLDRSFSASQLPTLCEDQLARGRSDVGSGSRAWGGGAGGRKRSSVTQGHTSSESSPGEADDPFGRKAWRSMKRLEVNKRSLWSLLLVSFVDYL
jgi:hypothetical protein